MIHICFNYHDGYYMVPQVMVASLLDTKNPDTQYTLHVMYNTLSDELKNKLEKIVDNRALVNYIDMSSEFPLFKECNWNVTTMYRIAIAEYLNDVDKIIYIDGDCLVFDDLTDMYNIDMNDNLFMGQADDSAFFEYYSKKLNTNFEKYICAGVMLMNLKKLREFNFKVLVNDYLNRNNGDTHGLADQGLINYLGRYQVSYLPAKYGLFWQFNLSEDLLIEGFLIGRTPLYYTEKEYIDGFKNIAILHLVTNGIHKKAFNYPYGITDKFGRKFLEIAYKYGIIERAPNKFIMRSISGLFVNVNKDNMNLELDSKNNVVFLVDDEYIYIESLNKYLSVCNKNITLTDDKITKWIIFPNVNKRTYQFCPRSAFNYALDIDHCFFSPGTKLQLWEMNNTPAQEFVLCKCT